jgi:hypothetical protein
MKKHTSLGLGLFVVLVLALAVSGCGGGGGPASPNSGSVPTPDPTPQPTVHRDAKLFADLLSTRSIRFPVYTTDSLSSKATNGELIVKLLGDYGDRLEVELSTTVKLAGPDVIWLSTNGWVDYHRFSPSSATLLLAVSTTASPRVLPSLVQVAGNKVIDLTKFVNYGSFTEDLRPVSVQQNADGNWPVGTATIQGFDRTRLSDALLIAYPQS